MLDQIVQVSEGLRQGAGQMRLMPAMKTCPQCGGLRMIASPSLGICEDCGSEMKVVEEASS